jgi:hypothetical protein
MGVLMVPTLGVAVPEVDPRAAYRRRERRHAVPSLLCELGI